MPILRGTLRGLHVNPSHLCFMASEAALTDRLELTGALVRRAVVDVAHHNLARTHRPSLRRHLQALDLECTGLVEALWQPKNVVACRY